MGAGVGVGVGSPAVGISGGGMGSGAGGQHPRISVRMVDACKPFRSSELTVTSPVVPCPLRAELKPEGALSVVYIKSFSISAGTETEEVHTWSLFPHKRR